jgi:formylglycine-generating enzyme required for sulfatase activity
MNGFAHRLPLLLALLMIQVAVTSVAAQTSDPVVPALPTLTKEDSPPQDSRLSRRLSRSEELALVPLDHFKECERCPAMIVVPGGSFTMGASADEFGSTADERPQHQVTFRSFAVGVFPVSRDEWSACVIGKGCSFRPFDTTSSRG